MTNIESTIANHPRSTIAYNVADRAERVALAGPIAAGPGTPGAIVTHAGNYIIPASIDGFHVCNVCHNDLPVKKYPTRPATPDGIVTRIWTCRDCRDYATAARKCGRPVHVPRTGVPNVSANIDRPAPVVPTTDTRATLRNRHDAWCDTRMADVVASFATMTPTDRMARIVAAANRTESAA